MAKAAKVCRSDPPVSVGWARGAHPTQLHNVGAVPPRWLSHVALFAVEPLPQRRVYGLNRPYGKLVPQLAFRLTRAVSHCAWGMPVLAVAASLLKPSMERSNTKPSFIVNTALSPSKSSLHCALDPASVSYAPMSVAEPCVRAAPRWKRCQQQGRPKLLRSWQECELHK